MLFLVADNLADYYQTEQYNYIEQNTIVVIETAIILPIILPINLTDDNRHVRKEGGTLAQQ